MSGVTIFSPRVPLWWLMRGAFHFGVLSYGLGASCIANIEVPLDLTLSVLFPTV